MLSKNPFSTRLFKSKKDKDKARRAMFAKGFATPAKQRGFRTPVKKKKNTRKAKKVIKRKRKNPIINHPIELIPPDKSIREASSKAEKTTTASEATFVDEAAGIITVSEAERSGKYVAKRVNTTFENLGGGAIRITKVRKNNDPVSVTDIRYLPPSNDQLIENDFRKWQKTKNQDFRPNNNQIRILILALNKELTPHGIKVKKGKISVKKQVNEIKKALVAKDKIAKNSLLKGIISVPNPSL